MDNKIDLTDRNDFHERNQDVVNGGTLRRSKMPKFCTSEEFDRIYLFESIFGREEHEDCRVRLFGISRFEKESLLCAPWNFQKWIEGMDGSNEIPWNNHNQSWGSSNRIKHDLFSLR